MCARYSISATRDQLLEAFSFLEAGDWPDELLPIYNAAPSLVLPIALQGDRSLTGAMWGLVPWWDAAQPLINITVENLLSKRTFHPLVRSHRAILPATGFFEWRTEGKKKLPMHFGRKDGGPFAFAALTKAGDEARLEAALLTAAPNPLVAPIHNRMPVMLDEAAALAWLAAGSVDAALEALVPIPESEMACWPVTPDMNRTSFQSARAVAPWGAAGAAEPSLFD